MTIEQESRQGDTLPYLDFAAEVRLQRLPVATRLRTRDLQPHFISGLTSNAASLIIRR